jgi:hypothetical protein
VRFLATSDGSRFTVSTEAPFDSAFASFRTFLGGNSGNTSTRLSVQLVTASLNVLLGIQPANVAIEDAVAREWVSVATFLTRVSTFVQEHPASSRYSAADRAAAESHLRVLTALNANTALVTPATIAGCPPRQ